MSLAHSQHKSKCFALASQQKKSKLNKKKTGEAFKGAFDESFFVFFGTSQVR
jgi:hypothetical protein